MEKQEKFNPTKYKNSFQKENYDKIGLLVPKGERAKLRAYAEARGQSLNSFILESIKKNME